MAAPAMFRQRGFRRRRAASDLANQLGGALRGAQNHSGINAALKAITGVAREIQFPRCAANAGGQEICALQEEVARRLGHAGILAAHHAANGDAALGIGNEKFLGLSV